MLKSRRLVFLILPAIGAIALLPFFVEGYLFSRALGCQDQIVSEQPDRTNKRFARVIQKECGATTRDSTHLVVYTAHFLKLFSKVDTLIVMDGRPEIRIDWLTDRWVRISVPKGTYFYPKESQPNALNIEVTEY